MSDDVDRLARKKAARRRATKVPPPACDCGVSKGIRSDHESQCAGAYRQSNVTPQDIADAAARIADRMTIKATERAPKRGKWTLCIACDGIAAGHVFTPCARCGSTATARFKDGKPVVKKRLSAGDSVPDEISQPAPKVSEIKAPTPEQPARSRRRGAPPPTPPPVYEW